MDGGGAADVDRWWRDLRRDDGDAGWHCCGLFGWTRWTTRRSCFRQSLRQRLPRCWSLGGVAEEVASAVEVCRALECRAAFDGGKSCVRKMRRRRQRLSDGEKMNRAAAVGHVGVVAFDSVVAAVDGECAASVAFDCANGINVGLKLKSENKYKAYLCAGRRDAHRGMYRVVGSDAVALAAVAASMFVRCVLRVTNRRFVFARFHHKDFLHFAIVEVVQFTHGRFGANNQLD